MEQTLKVKHIHEKLQSCINFLAQEYALDIALMCTIYINTNQQEHVLHTTTSHDVLTGALYSNNTHEPWPENKRLATLVSFREVSNSILNKKLNP